MSWLHMQMHGREQVHLQGHSLPVLGNNTIGVAVVAGFGVGRIASAVIGGSPRIGAMAVGVNPVGTSGRGVVIGLMGESQVHSIALAPPARINATMTRIARAM